MKRYCDGNMTGINIDALELIAMTPIRITQSSIPGVIYVGSDTIIVDKVLKDDVFPETDAPIRVKETFKQKIKRCFRNR